MFLKLIFDMDPDGGHVLLLLFNRFFVFFSSIEKIPQTLWIIHHFSCGWYHLNFARFKHSLYDSVHISKLLGLSQKLYALPF